MAFQPETNAWASGVYQWETTDPAQGGLGGVMNTPLLQLSSRTLWLKGQVETLAASISSSATLNSPAFIGNPTAPTAAQFDNDTSIATTAFVQRALGNLAGYDAYASSTTLVAAQAGRQILYHGGAAGTITLPAVSGLVAGAGFCVLNISSSTLTVQRSGSDVLLGVNGATSVVLGTNDSLNLVSAGRASEWIVFGGSAQFPYSSALANKANTSGTYAGLNVGSATNAGNADTVDGWHRDDIRSFPNLINKPAGADIPFNFSYRAGSPQYVWGSTDGDLGHSYVYAAANLSVSYAGSAGNADTVDGWHRDDIRAWGNLLNKPAGADIPFNWSGQAGQPAGLWGANDIGNTYVYDPSNFSVAYAANAANAGYATSADSAAKLSASPGSAPHYACRAWVNFDVTTNVIRAAGNVSSVTDLGTAYTRINFSSPMPDANYAVGGSGSLVLGLGYNPSPVEMQQGYVDVKWFSYDVLREPSIGTVTVHR